MNNKESVKAVDKILQDDIDRQVKEEELKVKKKLEVKSKYDKKIIILFGIGLLLLTIGIALSFIKKDTEDTKKEVNKGNDIEIKDTSTKSLEEVSTSDNTFKITKNEVNYSTKDNSSTVEINYISTVSNEELYLIITYKLKDSKVDIPVLLKNVVANSKGIYTFNTTEDLTKTKSCTVEFTTKDVLVNEYNYIV